MVVFVVIEAVIFDFDGVLVHSEPMHWASCNEIFNRYGFTLSEQEFLTLYRGSADCEFFPKVMAAKGVQIEDEVIQSLIKDKIMLYTGTIGEFSVIESLPNVDKFLEKASRFTEKIGICTACRRQELFSTLSKINGGKLTHYFKQIVTRDDVNAPKPAPDGYELAAYKLGVTPDKCLVIEDTPNGIKAAKLAGAYVIGITTNYNYFYLQEADRVIESFDEILDLDLSSI